MSVIVHRCPDCGHNDMEHPANPVGTSTCSHGNCPCVVPRRVVIENPPEVIPTWDARTGLPIEAITTPGETVGGPPIRSCKCPECVALCDRMGGVA